MQMPDYAVFRVGELVDWNEHDLLPMFGIYDKLELYSGVMVGLPTALCWPPPASFTWDWKRLLSDADYQALSFPPGWQTELYRGVVLAWTAAEAEALPDMEYYREAARRWIERHVPTEIREDDR